MCIIVIFSYSFARKCLKSTIKFITMSFSSKKKKVPLDSHLNKKLTLLKICFAARYKKNKFTLFLNLIIHQISWIFVSHPFLIHLVRINFDLLSLISRLHNKNKETNLNLTNSQIKFFCFRCNIMLRLSSDLKNKVTCMHSCTWWKNNTFQRKYTKNKNYKNDRKTSHEQ